MSWWDRQVDKSATLGRFYNYTPTFSADTGSWAPTIEIARYSQLGGLVAVEIRLAAGSASNDTAFLLIDLPVPVKNHPGGNYNQFMGACYLVAEAGVYNNQGSVFTIDGGTQARIFKSDQTTIVAGTALAMFNLFYEAERGY